jgi:hypothetical protein
MHLTFHLPALLSPPALHDTPLTATPVLERILARAHSTRTHRPGDPPWLAAQLGLGHTLPHARLLARRDAVPMLDEDILFAEPVLLTADHRTVHLSPGRTFEMNPIEAASIAISLEQHFGPLGLRFTASEAARVYVHCPRSERPTTTPVAAAARMPLLDAQPRSSGAIKWHAVQAEIEMLLNGHALNRLREKYQRPPITGVWFWGEGDEPLATPMPYDIVTTDTEWLQQLATERGAATRVSDWASARGARVLVHQENFANASRDGDSAAWLTALNALERGWCTQLAAGFSTGNVSSARFVVEHGAERIDFELDADAVRWRFWRRVKPLSYWMHHGAHSHA